MENKINVIEKRPELLTSADLEGRKVSSENSAFALGSIALRWPTFPLFSEPHHGPHMELNS